VLGTVFDHLLTAKDAAIRSQTSRKPRSPRKDITV
jgi:hypothetical protein